MQAHLPGVTRQAAGSGQALRRRGALLGLAGMTLGLAAVSLCDTLRVLGRQALDAEPLTTDHNRNGVSATLTHSTDNFDRAILAVLDGIGADLADPGLYETLTRLLVEATDLALDLADRLRRGLDRLDLLRRSKRRLQIFDRSAERSSILLRSSLVVISNLPVW